MAPRGGSLARLLLIGLALLLCPVLAGTAVAGNMARQAASSSAATRRGTRTLSTAVALQQAVSRAEALEASPALYTGAPAARAAFDQATLDALVIYGELEQQVEPKTHAAVRRGREAFAGFRAAGLGVGDPFVAGAAVRQTSPLGQLLEKLSSRVQAASDALREVYDAVLAQVSTATRRVARQQLREALLLVLLGRQPARSDSRERRTGASRSCGGVQRDDGPIGSQPQGAYA